MLNLEYQFIKTGLFVVFAVSASATSSSTLVEQFDLSSVPFSRSTCSVGVRGSSEEDFLFSSNLIIGFVGTVKCCRSSVGAALMAKVLAPVSVVGSIPPRAAIPSEADIERILRVSVTPESGTLYQH